MDLAVEVISPSNRAADMKRKIGKYFRSGAVGVWVVYPDSRSIELHQPTGKIVTLGGEERITSPVLPGFELLVSEIFRF